MWGPSPFSRPDGMFVSILIFLGWGLLVMAIGSPFLGLLHLVMRFVFGSDVAHWVTTRLMFPLGVVGLTVLSIIGVFAQWASS